MPILVLMGHSMGDAAESDEDLECRLREEILDVVTTMSLEHPDRDMEIWGWFTAYCNEIVNPVIEPVVVPEF